MPRKIHKPVRLDENIISSSPDGFMHGAKNARIMIENEIPNNGSNGSDESSLEDGDLNPRPRKKQKKMPVNDEGMKQQGIY